MEEYLYQILLREGTTEYALFQQFESGLHAYKPLCADDRLGAEHAVPFPISIVFGDRDWMDTRGSIRIVKRNIFFYQGKCNLYVLPKCGHQMAIDNPTGLVRLIIDDVSGRSKHVFQPAQPRIKYVDKDEKPLPEDEYDEILEFYTNKNPISWTTVENSSTYSRSTLRIQIQENKKATENGLLISPQDEDADMYGEENDELQE